MVVTLILSMNYHNKNVDI